MHWYFQVMWNAEVSTIKGKGAQKYSSCLLGKALISMYLAQITLLYLACELHHCWLGFSYMFNKNHKCSW